MCVCSVVSDSLRPHGLQPILCPWDFPSRNPGVSCHFLLQGLNMCLLCCRCTGYCWATREARQADMIRSNERLRDMFYLVPRESDVARKHPFGSWLFLFLSVFPWGNFLFIKLVYYIRRHVKCLDWSLASSKCSLSGCFNDTKENKRSTTQYECTCQHHANYLTY